MVTDNKGDYEVTKIEILAFLTSPNGRKFLQFASRTIGEQKKSG